MPLQVVGALDPHGSLSAGTVVATIRKLNASFGEVEMGDRQKSSERPSREAVKAGSSLRVLIAIRQANGEGAAEC